MRVLYATHPTAFQKYSAGGEIQLRKTRAGVEELGASVDYFNPFKSQIHTYDILHAFSSSSDLESLINYADDTDTKTAISTIYYDNVGSFLSDPARLLGSDYPFSIRSFVQKAIEEFAPGRIIRLFDQKKRLFDSANVLLPNSQEEKQLLRRRFNIPSDKIRVVPNGVEERFVNATPDKFEREIEARDFALFVCAIDSRKNLLKGLKALDGTGKDIVVIGAARDDKKEDREYAERVKSYASGMSESVYFLGHVPHSSSLLESAYAACDLFVLPSWFETPGLAALEAGLAGAKVVITQYGPTQEYFGKYAWYVDPTDVESIREGIDRARTENQQDGLQNRILNNFLWKHTAERTYDIYDDLLTGDIA